MYIIMTCLVCTSYALHVLLRFIEPPVWPPTAQTQTQLTALYGALQQIVYKISNVDDLNYKSAQLLKDIIFLDFAEAFDKLSHRKLVLKLQAHGIEN